MPGAAVEAIPEQVGEEKGIVFQITGQQAAWFGTQSIKPSQPAELHPRGSIWFGAGVDIKSESHGKNHATPDQCFVPMNPILLFRGAEADPDEIGGEAIDFVHDGRFVGRFEVAVASADDFEVGV